jgi:hypothetical protein
MACATLSSLVLTFKNNLVSAKSAISIISDISSEAEVIADSKTTLFTDVLQNIIIVPLVVLAVILIIDGAKVLFGKKQAA